MQGQLFQQGGFFDGRFHTELYNRNGQFIQDQMEQHLQYSGIMANIVPDHIRRSYFNPARPSQGQGTLVVVPARNIVGDPLQITRQQTHQVLRDDLVAGDQLFYQQRPETRANRHRGIFQAFTRELVNPITGAQTDAEAFSYMPHYPNETQVKIALAHASDDTKRRRGLGNQYYFQNAGQSFRYD